VENLELVEPSLRYRQQMLEMAAEALAAGDDRYQQALDMEFEDYIARLQRFAQGIGLPEGHVRQTTFWLVRDGQILLGSLRLRHDLTPEVEREHGQIGYDIRPSQRGKGYGTRQLALGIQKARELGFTRVLVTCDVANLASGRVIEKNGGVLENILILEPSGERISRDWIDLIALDSNLPVSAEVVE
jgi:predicted acetyltransferase